MIPFPARKQMEELNRRLPSSQLEEIAIPSYLHRNPLVPWIVNLRIRKVVQALELAGGERVLDFGCGTGILFYHLQNWEIHYTGSDVDLSPARYLLSGHQDRIELIEPNQLFNEVSDQSYERIAAVEVLEHLGDPERILGNLERKLTSSGILVITGPTENRFYQFCRRIAGFSGTYHRRNIDEIVQMAKSSGFVQTRLTAIPAPGPCALFKIIAFSKCSSSRVELSQ